MPQKRLSLSDLGELQRSAMEHVWEMGEATVNDVRDRINAVRMKKPLAYTTVLSVLQKLEATGWIGHRATGRTYLYRARQSREQACAASVKALARNVFGGDPLALFQQLLQSEKLSKEELAELHQMVDQHRNRCKS